MKAKSRDRDEMRAEYNFDYSKGVRGKYYRRLIKEGSNVVLLDPDVAAAFPSSKAVNDVFGLASESTRVIAAVNVVFPWSM